MHSIAFTLTAIHLMQIFSFSRRSNCCVAREQNVCIYPTWFGQAQLVLKAKTAGKVKVMVSGEGVESKTLTLDVK